MEMTFPVLPTLCANSSVKEPTLAPASAHISPSCTIFQISLDNPGSNTSRKNMIWFRLESPGAPASLLPYCVVIVRLKERMGLRFMRKAPVKIQSPLMGRGINGLATQARIERSIILPTGVINIGFPGNLHQWEITEHQQT